MSAVLSPSNTFSARLTLAAGALVTIEAPSMSALGEIVGKLQPTEAANDSVAPGKSKPAAATAPAGKAATQTAAPSAPAAAAPAAGDAGNDAAAAGPAAAASTASSSTPAESPEVSFEVLKKAFLALSTKADGRAKCESVLKPFGVAKLSESKPEQYAAVLAAIEAASK